MNKRSLALITATAVLVLYLLSPFAGAVTISYTADSGGESVSINENYDVDNTVTVKESTDISFDTLQVDQERTAEGTGEADLKQTISGKSVDGTGYVAENVILSEGTIDAKTYTSATGNTLGVAQTVSATGETELLLVGEESGNMAAHVAGVLNGRLHSRQKLDIGNSVRASLDASIGGYFGVAGSIAEDADGNWAVTEMGVIEGELSTSQVAEADGSAIAAEKSRMNGTVSIIMTGAENQYGETNIENAVLDGTLDSESGAIANKDKAFCSQDMSAEGSYIYKFVEANNSAGPYASDTTEVWDGTLAAIATATVNETSAEVTDSLSAEGLAITKSTYADAWVGYTEIDLEVDNGTLNGEFLGKASDVEAFCSQDMNFTGDLDEWIEVYNVVMSAGGWAHIWSTVPIEDPLNLWSTATVNETKNVI